MPHHKRRRFFPPSRVNRRASVTRIEHRVTQEIPLKITLRLVLQKHVNRYFGDNGVVNFSALSTCPDLCDIQSVINFNTRSFCHTLLLLASEFLLSTGHTLQYLIVDSNNITTLYHMVDALVETGQHKTLRGLSAAYNQLKDLVSLLLQLKRLQTLVEVRFLGNPILSSMPDAYKRGLRAELPWLVGADEESLRGAPLSLPWPVRNSEMTGFPSDSTSCAQGAMMQRKILILDGISHFFQALEHMWDGISDNDRTPCSIAQRFYVDGTLVSFTQSQPGLLLNEAKDIHSGGKRASRTSGIGSLQVVMDAEDANVLRYKHLMHSYVTHTMGIRGCSPLARVLYPPGFRVKHYWHPSDSHCTWIPSTGPHPFLFITIPGQMEWYPDFHEKIEQKPSPMAKLCFERSLVLIQSNMQQNGLSESLYTPLNDGSYVYLISNDAIALRSYKDSILWRPDSPERLQSLTQQYHAADGIGPLVASLVHNDSELVAALNASRSLPMSVVTECLNPSTQENLGRDMQVTALILCATLPGTLVSSARLALKETNGSLPLAVQLLQEQGQNTASAAGQE